MSVTLEEVQHQQVLTVSLKERLQRYGLRLDIGPGYQARDLAKFVTVDRTLLSSELSHVKPDVQADMAVLPYRDNTVEEIWASHVLEHAPMGKVPLVLREWLRVLRPGKTATIQVPNFDYVAKYWLTGPDRAWAEKMVFGEQAFGADDFHRSCFTPAILKADLEGVGFEVRFVQLRWTHSQETIQAIARKPR